MTKDERKTFGAEMAAKRRASGKTRGEVAELCRVLPQRIAALERGFAEWSPGIIERYLEAVK